MANEIPPPRGSAASPNASTTPLPTTRPGATTRPRVILAPRSPALQPLAPASQPVMPDPQVSSAPVPQPPPVFAAPVTSTPAPARPAAPAQPPSTAPAPAPESHRPVADRQVVPSSDPAVATNGAAIRDPASKTISKPSAPALPQAAPQKRVLPPSANSQTTVPGPRRGPALWPWLLLLVAAAVVGFYLYHRHATQAALAGAEAGNAGTSGPGGARGGHHGGADTIRVVVATASKGDMPIYLTGLGTVTPLNTVTVQSRVSGQLMKVLFTEGQMVKAGDLLLQIDTRPYDAQLEQYAAQKEHDVALLQNANVDLQRYQTLWKQDSIPQQTLATQESLVKQDEGTVDSDQALIDQTKLNITYCNITSPITGRVGLRLVDVGNYVQSTSSSGLVVITQLQPITVIFTIPEDNIQSVITQLNAGQTLPVDAFIRGGFTKKLADGQLLTLDNQIDPATGTVRLRATFPNTDNALFPNQFVNTRLLVDTHKGVILVPVAAIQKGNNGSFIYVVNTDNNTVKMQNVEVGTVALDGSNAEITSGIIEGDTVVTDGVDKLQDGAKIIISTPKSAEQSATPVGHDGSGTHHHHRSQQPQPSAPAPTTVSSA